MARRRRRRSIRNTTGRPRRGPWSARASSASTGPTRSAAARSTRSTSNVPGMLYARAVRSPYPRAKVVSIDFSAARARARFQGVAHRSRSEGRQDERRDVPGRRGRRRRGGHRRTRHRRRARGEGGVRGAAVGDQRRVGAGRPRARRRIPERQRARRASTQEVGDLAAGFKAAAHTLEQTYSTHVITHACMEVARHGVRVGRRQADGVGVDAGRQLGARQFRRAASSIPQTNVRVICQYMGGGFGSKLQLGPEGLICAQAREAGGRAGEDDARSQGRASRDRQPSVGGGEDQGGRRPPTGRSRRSTPSRGAPAAPARTRASRCPTSTTRSDRQPAPRAQGRVHQHRPAARRCARRAIRRDRSSPRS